MGHTMDEPRPTDEHPEPPIEDRPLRTTPPAAAEPPERPPRRPWGVVAVALLVIGAAVVWFLLFRQAPDPDPTPPGIELPPPADGPPPVEVVPAEPVEPIELPPLEDSDSLVRSLVGALSSHPQLAALLVSDDLVRRFVVSVDNVAEGRSPIQHWPRLKPEEAFRAAEQDQRIVVSPETYRRYDLLAEAFASLDTAGTVRLYRQLEPLVDEAYRDLGYPDADFDRTLERAARHLLDTPVVAPDAALVRGEKGYVFEDPEIEGLSEAQKLLLRTGPGNPAADPGQAAAARRGAGHPLTATLALLAT
jgi:hypothetical protein